MILPHLRRILLFALLVLAPVALVSAQGTTPVAAPPSVARAAVPVANLPSVIYLMRHAEKPVGTDKDPDLTPVGYHRADLLPTLFVAPKGSTQMPRLRRPDALFATDRSKHSNRPVETITPLSIALNLTINHDFEDHDTASIANAVLSGRYAGKVVVICWHHGELPHLAEALGVANPPHWEDTTFNQIWKVEYAGGQASLTPLAESLLPGDPAVVH